MRVAIALVGALLLIGVGGAPHALALSSSRVAAVLSVSTTADTINGNVASPVALKARPGPDGISLREAITASDNGPPGLVTITFAPSLRGKRISPLKPLPPFTHENTALVGLTTDGQPAVTLDAGSIKSASILLAVFASGVSISHVRAGGLVRGGFAIAIWAGTGKSGHRDIRNVRVESNILEGGNFGVSIGTATPNNHPANPTLSNITVGHNVISGCSEDGIAAGLGATNGSITNLSIEDNTIQDINAHVDSTALELGASFSGNKIVGTRIVGNSVSDSVVGLFIDGGIGNAAIGNTTSGTVISENVFVRDRSPFQLVGGLGSSTATGNAVLNVEFSNNVIADSPSPASAAAFLFGGEDGAAGNRVSGVRFVNDTIAFNAGGGLWLDSGPGNQITDVQIENSILWTNNGHGNVAGPAAGSVAVQSSLLGVDPRLVSATDFHLQPGSPAINAGASSGAPATDISGRQRVGQPDIGAYEFGG